MPQIDGKDIPSFVAWLETKGVRSSLGSAAVGDLQATQKEINSEKVESIRASGNAKVGTPILISSDGYVLDGHHRWAALLVDDPQNRIRVIHIGLPIETLLEVALKFPKSFSRDLNDKVASTASLARVVAWRYLCA